MIIIDHFFQNKNKINNKVPSFLFLVQQTRLAEVFTLDAPCVKSALCRTVLKITNYKRQPTLTAGMDRPSLFFSSSKNHLLYLVGILLLTFFIYIIKYSDTHHHIAIFSEQNHFHLWEFF